MNQSVIYELAILYHPSTEEKLEKVDKGIQKSITDLGGEILKADIWGKRQLAYEIKKQTHAIYVFYDLKINPEALLKIQTALNINEDILRHQFHKIDLKELDLALKHANSVSKDKKTPVKKK